jgi:Chitin synthase
MSAEPCRFKSVNSVCSNHIVSIENIKITDTELSLHSSSLFADPPKVPEFLTNDEKIFLNRIGYYSLIVSISLYSENYNSLQKSLESVFHNKASKSELFTKTLIVIISDGYEYLSNDNKQNLAYLNLYSEEYIKSYIDNTSYIAKNYDPDTVNEIAFVFENKLEYGNLQKFSEFEQNNLSIGSPSIIDVIFMTKLKNKKKLNSHLWLYKFFCERLCPKYVIVSSK